jgi:predicted amidophosphoribosyltransferase
VLLAPTCAACDALLDAPTNGCVCATCWSRVTIITPPICERCGLPQPSWRTTSPLCPRCRRRPSAIDRCRSAGVYEGALRDIIHAFKYDARRSLAKRLAALVRQHAADLLEGVDVITPVPLHRARERARGFNQSEDLARALRLPCAARCGAYERRGRRRTCPRHSGIATCATPSPVAAN